MSMPLSWGALTEELAAIRKRLVDLESARRLGNSSIEEGALLIRDGAGNVIATFGVLDDGSVGVDVKAGKITGTDITGANISGGVISIRDGGGAEVVRLDPTGIKATAGSISGATVTGGSLTGTTISGGSLSITSGGVEIVRIDSSGIVVAQSGKTARLDNVALGGKSYADTPFVTVTDPGGGNWITSEIGPTLTVETASGKLAMSGVIVFNNTPPDQWLLVSTEILNNATGAVVVAPVNRGNGTSMCTSHTTRESSYPVQGSWELAPGTYRVRWRYKVGGAVAPAVTSCQIVARMMRVDPR